MFLALLFHLLRFYHVLPKVGLGNVKALRELSARRVQWNVLCSQSPALDLACLLLHTNPYQSEHARPSRLRLCRACGTSTSAGFVLVTRSDWTDRLLDTRSVLAWSLASLADARLAEPGPALGTFTFPPGVTSFTVSSVTSGRGGSVTFVGGSEDGVHYRSNLSSSAIETSSLTYKQRAAMVFRLLASKLFQLAMGILCRLSLEATASITLEAMGRCILHFETRRRCSQCKPGPRPPFSDR